MLGKTTFNIIFDNLLHDNKQDDLWQTDGIFIGNVGY